MTNAEKNTIAGGSLLKSIDNGRLHWHIAVICHAGRTVSKSNLWQNLPGSADCGRVPVKICKIAVLPFLHREDISWFPPLWILKIKIYEFSLVSAYKKKSAKLRLYSVCGLIKVVGGFFFIFDWKTLLPVSRKPRLKSSQLVSFTHPLPGYCTIPINCIIARFSYIPGGCLIPFLVQMFEIR
jgi:hypothetical protein